MGVRGLESFMECYPETAYQVDVKEIVESYRRGQNTEVTIVVDGSSYLPYLYAGMDTVCGGQIRAFKELIQNAIQSFNKIGVKLVFFFDGPTQQRKRKVWVQRRLNRLKDVYNIFDDIKEGTKLCEIQDSTRMLIPSIALSEAKAIIKATEGCELYRSVKECDEEIVEYADQNKCFAILGQDTDFVISNGALYYLSAAHLNIKDMTTKNYDRQALACHLRISTGLLPLFASLVGNDIIRSDELSPFHQRICNANNPKGSKKFSPRLSWNIIYKVAEFIRHHTDEKHLYQALPMISRRVFGDLSKVSVLDLSVRSYSTNSPTVPQPIHSESGWKKIQKHAEMLYRSGNLECMIYAVLHELPYESYTGLEDFRQVDLPTSAAVYLPLRQHIYGIILLEMPNDTENHFVEEWCMQGERSLDEPTYVSVIFPESGTLNSLLLMCDGSSSKRLIEDAIEH